MSERVAFIYSEEFQEYNFSPTHPLQPVRLRLTYELLKTYGIFDRSQVTVLPGRLATDEELRAVHTSDYIEAVRKINRAGEEAVYSAIYGIGPGDNPAFPGMHEASSLIAGSSILAADLVMVGEAKHAVNIAGGLHHARSNRASGFCIYNDPACAIAHASQTYGARIAYIDIDAHHGDGVQWSFYDRSDVLTISLHESGRFLFPGTGFIDEVGNGAGEGYSVNVPLEPGIYDELYMRAFDEIVPPIVKTFKPDLIVSQNGCDTHYTDPLAGLSLTTNAYEQLYSRIHELAHEVCGGRLVALGGGGYQVYEVVPRAWALLTASIACIDLDNSIPDSWREFCASTAHFQCPRKLRDEPISIRGAQLGTIKEKTEDTILRVKQRVFPYFDLTIG
ncbi:MAG: acetoin utilization protein AcuC [Actinobacteria bacterium]|nr:acetoin utilization protein AcuC [Actinomycetota bacterium]